MGDKTTNNDEMQAQYQQPLKDFSTRAIHSGYTPENCSSSLAVVPSISLSTTFKQYTPGQPVHYEYSRSGNPTRDSLQKCYASLEDAKYSLAFSSGLAATMSIVHLLESGDHILAVNDLYGGTCRYFTQILSKFQVTVSYFAPDQVDRLHELITASTRLIWIETPTNPTMCVVDIKRVCAQVRSGHCATTNGRDSSTIVAPIVVVDSTFMSPYLQQPLQFGADIVLHSATKYLGGHSDLVMGVLATNSESLRERLAYVQNALGAVPSPFDCYMLLRSLRTLQLRMRQHGASCLQLAHYLEQHPCVSRVLCPALSSHPQHELFCRQTCGPSGMLSFYLQAPAGCAEGSAVREATLAESERFLASLRLVTLAESLGGYESLAELPSRMTHASMSEQQRAAAGITDSLIRLSVGLEDVQSIIDDVDQALSRTFGLSA